MICCAHVLCPRPRQVDHKWDASAVSISERLLLWLSRSPEAADYSITNPVEEVDAALAVFQQEFSDFGGKLAGKRVADFGCGLGFQSIALVQQYGCSVTGIDSNPATLSDAIKHRNQLGISHKALTFCEGIQPEMLGEFDVVISLDSFEHFATPAAQLQEMGSLLKKDGIVLITFGPPWLAPYGSHMHFFCRVPWINVLFSESAVMKVRRRFRSDGAERYEDVESGLNRMTVGRFEAIVDASRMQSRYRHYACVRHVNCLSCLPLFREFFINRVSAELAWEHSTLAK